jgi:sulfite reductase (NADPH) flavoprotein alpha-component
MNESVPVIPESAPFTPEQRAYLNGFLAGLFSRGSVATAPSPQASATIPLSILFGSQTGNAEALAKRAANEARKLGFAPAVHDLATYAAEQLPSERRLLVITSTYGDGDPPDNAKPFWERIRNGTAPTIADLQYAVLALGDSSYPKFCAFGKAVDDRLEAMGGKRAHPRLDCDVDFDTPFANWIVTALQALAGSSNGAVTSHAEPDSNSQPSTLHSQLPEYGRSNPFPAPLIANRKLNAPGSSKDTRHLAFSLEGSGLEYEVGDALAVRPRNCPDLVGELIAALRCSGSDALNGVSVHHALLHDHEITRVPASLIKAAAERCSDDALRQLSGADFNKFAHGMDVLDFIRRYPQAKFCAADVALLKKLPPRLYSISSSPKAHREEVHLCVGVVRTEFGGRLRKGVCSTFLADRVEDRASVPVFVHHNKNFRLPSDPSTPMIMVGPGTGIAPFRAFLEERRAIGANGKNWLFFGDQHAATDFLYRDEIEVMLREGTLARLDTAFSRDQAEKIYVQQRMLEHAQELFAWLEDGAHFYVCGDASRMAKDVDRALHQVVEAAGGRTVEQAADYIRQLSAAKRYQRDVY